jgi:predicted phosphodiesterase
MSTRRDNFIAKYHGKIFPSDTRRSLGDRLGIGLNHAKKLLQEARAYGMVPPYTVSEDGHASFVPAKPDVVPTEPVDTTPKLNVRDDGSADLQSIDAVIRTPEELVEAANLDLDAWEIVSSRVNTWPATMKGDDGRPVVVRLWQVRVDLKPRVLPLHEMALWEPPQPYVAPEPFQTSARTAVVIPDAQIGGHWRFTGSRPWLDPTHDRRAIDVVLQVIKRETPSDIVILGDMLDFAPLSTRWPTEDHMRQTTRLSIMEWKWLLWRIRQLAPQARIIYCEGNHEERYGKFLKERGGELVDVVPTLPDLLGLSKLRVEYVPYRSESWLWDRIRCIHGEVVASGGGATAANVLKSETHPVVYGHIHRCEVAHRRVTTPAGPKYLWAMSPGCLCRIDGSVPGSSPKSDWAQGVGIITEADGLPDAVEVVRITNGRALHRGEVLQGHDYVGELVTSSGTRAFLPE